MMLKICPNCKKTFSTDKENQIYCCRKCGIQYRKEGKHATYKVKTFKCKRCGRLVITKGGKDKRTCFCSKECEKGFWKHPEAVRNKLDNITHKK